MRSEWIHSWLSGFAGIAVSVLGIEQFLPRDFEDPSKLKVAQLENHIRPTRLEELLNEEFVSDETWDAVLSASSPLEITRCIDTLPKTFWQSGAIAHSSAYRIFRVLAKSNGRSALEQAIKLFSRDEFGRECSQACLRWAVLGISEKYDGILTEQIFVRCPHQFWPSLINGCIMGSVGGSISEDLKGYRNLLTRVLREAEAAESKIEIDQLLGVVLNGWIERDPIAVFEWLHTDEGKSYTAAIPQILAAIALGNPDALSMLLSDARYVIDPDSIASAVFRSRWDAAEMKKFASNFPQSKRAEFINAYAHELMMASPRTLQKFIQSADGTFFFTPDVAKILAFGTLSVEPRLFEKLSANMQPVERDKLLDDSFKRIWTDLRVEALRKEAASFYLQYRNGNTPLRQIAVSIIAPSDLSIALNLISKDTSNDQEELIKNAYCCNIEARSSKGESIHSLFDSVNAAPAELKRAVATDLVTFLGATDSSKCLDALKQYYPRDLEMWTEVFKGTVSAQSRLSVDTMNEFLDDSAKSGVDAAIYAIAAPIVAGALAREDLGEAQAAIEAMRESKEKDACRTTLMPIWGSEDALGACDYVSKLPAGQGRDAAVSSLVPTLCFAPEKQMELLSLVSSETARDALRVQINKAARKTQ